MVLNGYKTYVAAVLALAGAAYFVFVEQPEKAFELFVAFLGLVGLRSALNQPK